MARCNKYQDFPFDVVVHTYIHTCKCADIQKHTCMRTNIHMHLRAARVRGSLQQVSRFSICCCSLFIDRSMGGDNAVAALGCVAVCYSVLQCLTGLQCVAVRSLTDPWGGDNKVAALNFLRNFEEKIFV